MTRKHTKASVFAILVCAFVITATSQQLAQADIDRIVSAATAKETEFRNAFGQYNFKRDAKVQSIAQGGQISGEYRRTSQLVIDASGKRVEKIEFFPVPTLTGIRISAEELDEPGGVSPFALESSKAAMYTFKYAGKERIDELDLHVFDVTPKRVPDPKTVKDRLFQGRIWIDVQSNVIVKTRGKAVPESKLAPLPNIEIYREEIEGNWFPTYAYGDEEVVLDNGYGLRVRMKVTFSDFERVKPK